MSSGTDSDDFAGDVAGSVVESILDLAATVLPGAGPLTKRLVGKVREEVRRNREPRTFGNVIDTADDL